MAQHPPPTPWIAGFGYAAKVLGHPDPWATPSAMGSFARDAAKLLWLRVLDLDLAPLVASWVAERGVIPADGLVDVFDDPWWGERLEPALGAVAASAGGLPVALSFPELGALADMLAGPGTGADDLARDDLAIGLSALIRLTAPLGVSWFMFRDLGAEWADFLDPVVNVAEHMTVSLTAVSTDGGADALPAFQHVFTGSAVVGPSFWLDPAAPAPVAGDGPLYTELPVDANPERVRALLSAPPWSV